MKKIQKLSSKAKKVLQRSDLKRLKSLKIRRNGVYGRECKTLLHLASKYSSSKIVKYCLNVLKQQPEHKTRFKKNTALHYSCKYGKISITKLLLKTHPTLLNLQNKRLETPLMVSAKHNQPQSALFLLRNSANCLIQDKKGWTVGHWAAYHGMFEVLSALVAHNFDFSLKNAKQENLLHVAAWNGNIECFHLIANHIRADVVSSKGSVIEYCKGNWELMRWIFQNRLVRAKGEMKFLYENGAPIEVFLAGNLDFKVYHVLMHDRDDILEYLIRNKEIDTKMLRILRPNSSYSLKKCQRFIDRELKWDRIKTFVYWHKNLTCNKIPRGIFQELIQF